MEYITTKEIAMDLGLGIRTIQKYIQEGFVPSSFGFKGSGIKKGKISKYIRADKPLTISEFKEIIEDWLESLAKGTLNGKVYR
jgi:predicted transcriptional regulator